MNDFGIATVTQRDDTAAVVAADHVARRHSAAPFDPKAGLMALIQSRVLPELAERYRKQPRCVHPRAVELTGLLLSDAVEPIEKLLKEAATQEKSILSLRIALLEMSARLLGNMWLEDACTETDVVVALTLMQSAVRRAAKVRPIRLSKSSPGRVLVAPLPGETHFLGVVLASDTLYEKGWGVTVAFPADVRELIRQLRSEQFDMLHLALSDVIQREACLPLLRRAIKMARSASINRTLKITVGGRIFAENKTHPKSFGAEMLLTAH